MGQLHVGTEYPQRLQPVDVAYRTLLEVHLHLDGRLGAVEVGGATPRSAGCHGGPHGAVRAPPRDQGGQADPDPAVLGSVPGLDHRADPPKNRVGRFGQRWVVVAIGPPSGQHEARSDLGCSAAHRIVDHRIGVDVLVVYDGGGATPEVFD